MHLQRRDPGVGGGAAERRGDALVGRRRDERERIGRLDSGRYDRQPRAVLLLEVGRGQLHLARRRLREHVGEEHRVLAARRSWPARVVGRQLRSARTPPRRGSAGSIASSISSCVGGREARLGEAEARGQPPEDLHVGQRLALRRDHRLGALQPVLAVGGEEVVVLEVACRPAARRRSRHGCRSSPRRCPP